MAEPWREVRDGDAAAAPVVQAGYQDRRIDEVLLLVADVIDQLDRQKAEILVAGAFSEQGTERGIAVEAGEAGPHDLAAGIDQGANRAVPDQAETEGGHPATAAKPCSNQARTASTSPRRQRATVRPGPTLIE